MAAERAGSALRRSGLRLAGHTLLHGSTRTDEGAGRGIKFDDEDTAIGREDLQFVEPLGVVTLQIGLDHPAPEAALDLGEEIGEGADLPGLQRGPGAFMVPPFLGCRMGGSKGGQGGYNDQKQ